VIVVVVVAVAIIIVIIIIIIIIIMIIVVIISILFITIVIVTILKLRAVSDECSSLTLLVIHYDIHYVKTIVNLSEIISSLCMLLSDPERK